MCMSTREPIPTLHRADRAVILAHLSASDQKLARVIERVGHCNVQTMRGLTIYESLLRSIVYQQLAGKAAAAIFERVQRLYVVTNGASASLAITSASESSAGALTGAPAQNNNIRIPRKTAALPYPSPEQIANSSIEFLRSAGLSQAKALAVKDLAEKALDGTVPSLARARVLSDEELIGRLTTIRGIGQWTVEMMLIFRLGRLDVLPVSDYGVRKGFQITYGMRDLPKPEEMHRRAKKWAPYRSIGSWMMWRVLEFEK
jgi:DNA-3-methyladenine glycosylase II